MSAGEPFTDEGGDVAVAQLKKSGHATSKRKLISDDPLMLRKEVKSFISGDDDVLLLTGGTGVSSRDVTVETVRPFFEKELQGFGELFRRVSYDEVGTASILSRATAGVARGKLLVCLPGSPKAVKTALSLTLREFPHIVFIARS